MTQMKWMWPPSVPGALLGSHGPVLHPRAVSGASPQHPSKAPKQGGSNGAGPCVGLQRLVLIRTGGSNFINQLYFTEQSLHKHSQYKLCSKERVKGIS